LPFTPGSFFPWWTPPELPELLAELCEPLEASAPADPACVVVGGPTGRVAGAAGVVAGAGDMTSEADCTELDPEDAAG